MTKPRLLVHIGTHKTGTTTIQQALDAQGDAYLAAGVFYPPTDREPWPTLPKHCSVFAAAAHGDADQAEAERHILLSQFRASGARTMLISEEGLSEPPPRLAQFFAPFATEFDIEVVCFLRRPDLFTESLYNQFVRQATRREMRSPLMFSRAKGLRDRLKYAAILDRWKALPARITVIDFDRAVSERPLLRLFAESAGLPPLTDSGQRANSSPDMRLAQVLSHLNRQGLNYDLPSLIRASKVLETDERFVRRNHLLGRQERAQLLRELGPDLQRLADEYGVHFSAELPRDEGGASCEDIDPAYALELLARVSAMHRPAPEGG